MSIELPVGIKRALERLAFSSAGQVLERILNDVQVNVWEPADEEAMLALVSAKQGDIAIRGDGGSYVLSAEPPSTLENWIELSASGSGGLAVSLDGEGQGDFTSMNIDTAGGLEFTDEGEGLFTLGGGGGGGGAVGAILSDDNTGAPVNLSTTPQSIMSVSIPDAGLYLVRWSWAEDFSFVTTDGNCASALFAHDGSAIMASAALGGQVGTLGSPPTEVTGGGGNGSYLYEAAGAVTMSIYGLVTRNPLTGNWTIPDGNAHMQVVKLRDPL